MADITITKAARTLIAAGTSSGAGVTTRGGLDMRTVLGGLFTGKITNGATGPTTPCECRLLVSHDAGTLPALGSEGATWKTLVILGNGGTTNNAVTTFSYRIPRDVMHLEVEYTGHTVQGVTVEAFVSESTKAVST